MINISYVPAYDPYHAIFRLFVLFPDAGSEAASYEVFRILDFYVCFPFMISGFTPPRDIIKAHNVVKRSYTQSEYQVTPSGETLFRRMRPAQGAAANTLQAYGYLEVDAFRTGAIVRTDKPISEALLDAVQRHRENHHTLIEFLSSFKSFPLHGPQGLKARSRLEEFRYDHV